MANENTVALKVDEVVDQIEKAFGMDGLYELDGIADDLEIGVVDLVERIKNEIVARIAG